MAEVKAREAKLIQYLNEAYGTEKRLETALTAHISMTTRAPYKKRLQQHLTETRSHESLVSQRLSARGASPSRIKDLAGQVTGAGFALFAKFSRSKKPSRSRERRWYSPKEAWSRP